MVLTAHRGQPRWIHIASFCFMFQQWPLLGYPDHAFDEFANDSERMHNIFWTQNGFRKLFIRSHQSPGESFHHSPSHEPTSNKGLAQGILRARAEVSDKHSINNTGDHPHSSWSHIHKKLRMFSAVLPHKQTTSLNLSLRATRCNSRKPF